GLVVARNRFQNAFAQIDVQLKRRYDLIPNLIECVKGYMAHERETLDAVIKARRSAMAAEQKVAANPSDPAAMKELNQAEAQPGRPPGKALCPVRGFPGPKGKPKHANPEGGADPAREQDRLRPAGVQRRRHRLQQPPPDLPGRHGGRHVRLHSGGAARSRPGRARSARYVLQVTWNSELHLISQSHAPGFMFPKWRAKWPPISFGSRIRPGAGPSSWWSISSWRSWFWSFWCTGCCSCSAGMAPARQCPGGSRSCSCTLQRGWALWSAAPAHSKWPNWLP